MADRQPPLLGRVALRWHTRRGHTLRYNNQITVPPWDPISLGIYAKCSCGKE